MGVGVEAVVAGAVEVLVAVAAAVLVPAAVVVDRPVAGAARRRAAPGVPVVVVLARIGPLAADVLRAIDRRRVAPVEAVDGQMPAAETDRISEVAGIVRIWEVEAIDPTSAVVTDRTLVVAEIAQTSVEGIDPTLAVAIVPSPAVEIVPESAAVTGRELATGIVLESVAVTDLELEMAIAPGSVAGIGRVSATETVPELAAAIGPVLPIVLAQEAQVNAIQLPTVPDKVGAARDSPTVQGMATDRVTAIGPDSATAATSATTSISITTIIISPSVVETIGTTIGTTGTVVPGVEATAAGELPPQDLASVIARAT